MNSFGWADYSSTPLSNHPSSSRRARLSPILELPSTSCASSTACHSVEYCGAYETVARTERIVAEDALTDLHSASNRGQRR